jgi:hypothetical protein
VLCVAGGIVLMVTLSSQLSGVGVGLCVVFMVTLSSQLSGVGVGL